MRLFTCRFYLGGQGCTETFPRVKGRLPPFSRKEGQDHNQHGIPHKKSHPIEHGPFLGETSSDQAQKSAYNPGIKKNERAAAVVRILTTEKP